MNGLQWFFNILLLILYIATGVYITKASVALGPYTNDPNIATAHKYAVIASVIPWILIALSIIGIIIYFVYFFESGAEVQLIQSQLKTANSSSWWPTIFFIIMLLLITLTGILSAAAAHYIQISNSYSTSKIPDVITAFTDALISSILCISIVIIIIGILIYRAIPETPAQPETIKVQKL